MTRIQMDFRVTVMVDVNDKRPSHLTDLVDPVEYAKQFVSLTPCINGSHLVDIQNGMPVQGLEVVSSDVDWSEVYVQSKQ